MSAEGEKRRRKPDAITLSFLRRRDLVVLALCGIVIALLYSASVTPDLDDNTARHQAHRYYAWQAEAWLQGRLDLARTVPSELLALPDPYDPKANESLRMGGVKGFHDLSLYQGKFYMYWGPAPVLVAFLPWRLLTGHHLSTAGAAWGFGWVGWLASALLITRLVRRQYPETPVWLQAGALLGLGVCSWAPVVYFRASVWELAIYAACCFGAITWWMLLESAWTAPRTKWIWLAGASFSAALAIGSRPIWIAATLALAWPLWEERRSWRTLRFRGLVLAAGVPVTLGVAALLWHNYARFGSITEFGQGWQLAAVRMQGSAAFGATNLFFNLRQYLFGTPELADYFPFLLSPRVIELPKGYLGLENTFGLFLIQPWLCLVLLLLASQSVLRATAPVILGFIGLSVLLALFAGAALRYELEVATPLCLLAAAAWVGFRRPARWPKTLWVAAPLVLLAASCVGAVLVQSRMLITEQKVNTPHPLISRLANRLTTLIGYTPRDGTYGVEMDVIFPPHEKAITGIAQGLVISGIAPNVDCVLVDYPDPNYVRFSYHHPPGFAFSPPLALARGVPHHLRIEFGGLLPPVTHPFWGNLSLEQIETRRRQFTVFCDGKQILRGALSGAENTFPPVNAEPTVGYAATNKGRELVFTGTVANVRFLRIERPDVPGPGGGQQ